MKKLDFFRYAAIFAAGILLFAACSDNNDNGKSNGEESRLTERGGDPINTQQDIDALFAALTEEFAAFWGEYYDTHQHQKYEWGYRAYGILNGYCDWKEIPDGESYRFACEQEFTDYSNKGVLYLGGSVIIKAGHRSVSESDGWSGTINGKINFNGKFKGTLDFQNFKYETIYGANREPVNSPPVGKIMLGTHNITDRWEELFDTDIFQDG